MKKINIDINSIETFEKVVSFYCSLGYIFRGLPNTDFAQLPSLLYKDKDPNEQYVFYEKENASNKKIFEFGSKHNLTRMESLVLARHFGYCCRLVDYTRNPFVALYFVCSNNDNKDKNGKVLLFNLNQYITENNPVLKNLNNYDWYTNEEILDFLEDYEKYSTISLETIDEDGNERKTVFEYPIPIYPYFVDSRHTMQDGLFLMWCDLGIPQEKVLKLLDKYTSEIVVPSNCKQKILTQLENKNIIESNILSKKSFSLSETELNEFETMVNEINESLYK